jgi:4-diphosphocytidyl-2-C-methyl-D-erythritol kinase
MPMFGSFTLPSFAKINWDLHIFGRRDDGYHELCTTLQTISLHDEISFTSAAQLSLASSDPLIPTDSSNLILRAAELLRSQYSVRSGAHIHLEKRIPSPGGLGGGSSNAGVALIGLSRLWQLKVDLRELESIGSDLGSDVPFFFHGGTAIATGRGEKIEPVQDKIANFMLIVTPAVAVPTRDAFGRLNAPNLTSEAPNRILQICRSNAESPDLRLAALKNDFEPSVLESYPEIARVRDRLNELGAVHAALSGSGASVYAVFDKEETRQATLKALDKESTWRKFAVATISRSQYREALQLVY